MNRYSQLATQGWAAPQRAQTAQAAQDQAKAAVTQAQATLEAERQAAQSLGSARAQTAAQAAAAHAAVESARIDLSRTEIRAPVAGVVGARGVRVGQYVRPGGALMSLVPLGDAYVVANFKETQVSRMTVGQAATIKVDALEGAPLKGVVESFAPGSGSQFSLLPFEPGTGNFTKIVQRVPVRVRLEPGQPGLERLRPGLSTTVKVRLARD
jgi:membrane fusion protein (multidrug efflux system)